MVVMAATAGSELPAVAEVPAAKAPVATAATALTDSSVVGAPASFAAQGVRLAWPQAGRAAYSADYLLITATKPPQSLLA
jgi:hypothetical protein